MTVSGRAGVHSKVGSAIGANNVERLKSYLDAPQREGRQVPMRGQRFAYRARMRLRPSQVRNPEGADRCRRRQPGCADSHVEKRETELSRILDADYGRLVSVFVDKPLVDLGAFAVESTTNIHSYKSSPIFHF